MAAGLRHRRRLRRRRSGRRAEFGDIDDRVAVERMVQRLALEAGVLVQAARGVHRVRAVLGGKPKKGSGFHEKASGVKGAVLASIRTVFGAFGSCAFWDPYLGAVIYFANCFRCSA